MGKRFSVGMEGEPDSGGKKPIVPEGDQILIIKEVNLVTAEQADKGNAYFKWVLESKEGIEIKVITTLIKGVRWLLKQLLFACGVEAKEDDPEEKYTFTEEDVIGKSVIGVIKHAENTFIGNKGNKITFTKAEVKQFKKIGGGTPKTETSKNKTSDKGKEEDEEIPF